MGKLKRYYNGVPSRQTTRCCSAGALICAASIALYAANHTSPLSLFPIQTLWTLPLNNQLAPASAPAFEGADGFFPIEGGRIVAYDLARGTQKWIADARPRSEPAAGGGLLFVVEDDGIRARRAATGRLEWELPFSSALAEPPVWDNGWLIAVTRDREVLAFRAADGHLIWRRNISASAHARPALAADRVYVPTEDGRVVALNVETGDPLWERRMGGAANDILALEDRLYVGSNDNFFYCLRAATGAIDWKWRTGGDIVGRAAADDHRVYFVSLDNVLRAMDLKTGAQRWKTALPLRPVRGPVLAGNALIVSGLSTTARAYATADGKAVGDIAAGGELAAPPHLLDAGSNAIPTLIVVTRDIAKGATVVALTRAIDPPIVPIAPLPNVTPIPAPK